MHNLSNRELIHAVIDSTLVLFMMSLLWIAQRDVNAPSLLSAPP